MLQEKTNTYKAFIEIGEMIESYPPSKDKKPKIRVNGLYELPEQLELLIDGVTKVLKDVGIEFEFVRKEDNAIRNM